MPLRKRLENLLKRIEQISDVEVEEKSDATVLPDMGEDYIIKILDQGIEKLENELVNYKNQLEESSIMLETQLEEISKTYEELSTLYEVTRILSHTLDPVSVVDRLIESIKNSIPAEGIGIYFSYLSVEDFFCSVNDDSNLMSKLRECKNFVIEYLKKDDVKILMLENEKLEEFGISKVIKSMIIIPISSNNKCYGGIVLANRELGGIFTAGDRKLLESIANQIHFSIENFIFLEQKIEQERLREQISIAKEIQNSLLPSVIIQPKNTEIAASFSPAVEVAGDYYDVFFLEDKTFLIVADVSGKGIPASLLMSSFRSAVRIMVQGSNSLPELVSKVNDHIAQSEITDRFVTSMFVLMDTNEGSFKYSNAGHDPIILYRKETDEFFEISNNGIPIGIFQDQLYVEETFNLKPGDVFVIYTDGIPEARNEGKEEFGFERLKEVIKTNYNHSATEIKNEILYAVEEFVGTAKQHDDTTFIVVRYL
ncbi:MAG: GAF domain-containing SpoIIE family protein phosphatase [Thermotogota bacterium]|nr:GAF domain-containing SpoIIE family protein phosphatase [Thermotogota bacterium]